jgi:hypothetical protein
MIVYRDKSEAADPRPLLASLSADLGGAPGHADAAGLLADFGEVEAGIADALFPDRDGVHPVADALRAASLALGRLLLPDPGGSGSGTGSGTGSAAAEARRRVDAVAALPLPARISLRPAEGHAYYALYPETYLAAARRFARGERPGLAVVIGIRSIGTSLSAAVAAGLEAEGVTAETLTLRPRGHPFDRRPVPDGALAGRLRKLAQGTAWFLVVDEGPGLSGSSFCGTAALLSEMGVPDGRIVLFPSWLPDPDGFVNKAARSRWRRHPKVHAGFEEAWLPGSHLAGAADLSGGAWRGLPGFGMTGLQLPVQPQHERRKYLAGGTLHRFAGLGRHGAARLRRAEELSAAGFSPAPRGIVSGFLALDWREGRPLGRIDRLDPGLLATAARYLGHLGRRHATGRAADPEALMAIVETNVAEGLGADWTARLGPVRAAMPKPGEAAEIALDGRMMPHDWLRLPDGSLLKTDALDHHDDHFQPGPQGLAWDLAGFAAEFGLPPPVLRDLAQAAGAEAGDPRLEDRLPFHLAAYLAFRLGYAQLAARTLGSTPDGLGMARLEKRYRCQLQRLIAALG